MSEYTIKALQKQAHAIACDRGWWDTERRVGELLALVHSEVSEALEEARKGDVNVGMPHHAAFAEELADCVIRIMDMSEAFGVDLESAILWKMETNRRRPHRHGKEF
jgi:NTP pyrophosphatase (non-canonical NTP hydrolase)